MSQNHTAELLKALEDVLPYTEAERLAEGALVRCGAKTRNPIETAVRRAVAAISKAKASSS